MNVAKSQFHALQIKTNEEPYEIAIHHELITVPSISVHQRKARIHQLATNCSLTARYLTASTTRHGLAERRKNNLAGVDLSLL